MQADAKGAGAEPAALDDPDRLTALGHTGLLAGPDRALDRFAAMVRKILEVPVALVSLVDEFRQFFPGAAGLAQPWLAARQTPLSHSFCQQVVLSARPLVVTDARVDPELCGSPAIPDLGVTAFAGMPLTDENGYVLGSLCVIEPEPREWQPGELEVLSDLAAACSSELRLRIAARRAEHAHREAVEALDAQRQAQAEVERLSRDLNQALERNTLLLTASEALTDTTTVEDVVSTVAELVSSGLAPAHVGLMLLDERSARLELFTAGPPPTGLGEQWVSMDVASNGPAAVAVRQRRVLFFENSGAFARAFPDLAEDLAALGWEALVCAPLIGATGVLGTLRLAWSQPHLGDVGERAVILTLAGYVARALERARTLRDRVSVAETLQRAMLTALPSATGYHLAARYQPAHSGEEVGGDWYDAIALPGGRLAVVIGDVVGHDMAAAARMGQLRSMLRAYLVDRAEPPAAILRRLDAANYALGDRSMATLLVAILEPDSTAGGGYLLHWSCAGHPPPVLIQPDGGVETLAGRGLILGARWKIERTTETRLLPAGSTLLLYTDGLVEIRGEPLDEGLARLNDFLAERPRWPLERLLDAVVAEVPGPQHEDDIAVLAVRLPAAG